TNYEWVGPTKQQDAIIKHNTAQWSISIYDLKNKESFLLTDAILVGKIVQIRYVDSGGNDVTSTDPVVIAQYVRIDSKEMWQDGYVIKVGTVKPGASRKFLLKTWYSLEGLMEVQFDFSTWYLP
ncbi:hypothetical protein ACFL4C_04270, partial [Candidatus Omnitrophota bacterium]